MAERITIRHDGGLHLVLGCTDDSSVDGSRRVNGIGTGVEVDGSQDGVYECTEASSAWPLDVAALHPLGMNVWARPCGVVFRLYFDLTLALGSLRCLGAKSLAEGRSVRVIVSTKHDASAVQSSLKTSKITTTFLGPDERDQPDSKSVRIATMHRAKGLEFDEVVLLIPRNWSNVRSGSDNSRQLKYVAMTRAKRVATIVEY
jgi:hypothetical protein